MSQDTHLDLQGTPYSISKPLSKKVIESFGDSDEAIIQTDINTLASDMQHFNTDYMNYINCAKSGATQCIDYNGVSMTTNALRDRLNGISETSPQNDTNDYYHVFRDNAQLLSDMRNHPPSSSAITGNKDKYNEVLKKRNELDVKLRELNNTQDSIANNYKQQYDATIYSGVLLSALAASLLYFVFKEL